MLRCRTLLLLIPFFYLFDLLASPHILDEPIDRVVVTSCHNRLYATNLQQHFALIRTHPDPQRISCCFTPVHFLIFCGFTSSSSRDPISTTLLEQIGCILRDVVFPSLLLPRLSTPCYHLSWSAASLLLHIQHSFRLPASFGLLRHFFFHHSLSLLLHHTKHGAAADCVTSDSYNFCVFSLAYSLPRAHALTPRCSREGHTLSCVRYLLLLRRCRQPAML